MQESKKNQNSKLLKELSNSTSSLNAALEAISSQNKMLVKELKIKEKYNVSINILFMSEATSSTNNFLIKIDKIKNFIQQLFF